MAQQKLPRLMGVLNVTPDSFSDGGKFNTVESALAQASLMIAQGATVVDVGGESTRPGATRLSAAEEQQRVLPVIRALAQLPEIDDGRVLVSIDTMNAATAIAAVDAGASIVNDVSGGLADARMFEVFADLQTRRGGSNASSNQVDQQASSPVYVLGHWQNFEAGSAAVQETADIVASVSVELAARVRSAEAAGVNRRNIVLDPGLGFGKDSDQNWQLVSAFEQLADLGLPILIGASRKRFLASQIADSEGIGLSEVTLEQRDEATAALSAKVFGQAAAANKIEQLWGFRVHNVGANLRALQSAAALRFANQPNDRQS